MNALAVTTSTTTTSGVTFPTLVLTAMVWSALLFALVALFMPNQTQEQLRRIKSLGSTGAGAALFFAVWAVESQTFEALGGTSTAGVPGGDLFEQHSWLSSFPITATYHLDADAMALSVIVVVSVVFFCAALASWRNQQHVKLLTVCLLTLETACLGVLASYDWVLFLLFWSLAIPPVYVLARAFGPSHRARVATRYAATSLVAGGLLLLAAVLIAFQAGGTPNFDMGSPPVTLPGDAGAVAFWMITAASLLTMAVVPLHGALLDLEEDSTGVLAAVFAAVLPSLGAYTLVHVAVGFFPTTSGSFSLFFAALAVVTVVWGGLGALRADDLRRLVGHVGTVLMGLVLLGVAGHTTIAVTGIIYLLLARGLVIAGLMLLASLVQEKTRRARISQLGGLAWQAPFLSAFWVLTTLAAAGVPLLAGFAGDFFIFTGSFPAHRWASTVVLAGTVFTSGVLVWTAQRVFLGASRDTFARVRDLGPLELTYLGLLAGLIVLIGVVPGHFGALFQNGAGYILFPGSG
ncbi:MAG: proton-conducting transporter membrane subunit [Candidatus Dormibacteria bacterium]|jgi:NADH-quinone oxidoreductase subunit M